MAYCKMNAISWPEEFTPGLTENFASNEVFAAGVTAAQIWPLLNQPLRWPTYYDNASKVEIHDGKGPELAVGTRFFFVTFGFPIECECTEYILPAEGQAGRIAWKGWCGEGDQRVDIYHAWIIEDVEQGRVRLLTQESQKGQMALVLANTKPNPMINGHQNWLDGLVATARAEAKK